MYSTHDEHVYPDHVTVVRRGKSSRPMFVCCGSIGLIFGVLGGIILGIGHQRLRQNQDEKDYSYILVGSVVFACGVILTVLAFFLSISWSKITRSDSQQLHEAYHGQWTEAQGPMNSQYGTAVCE